MTAPKTVSVVIWDLEARDALIEKLRGMDVDERKPIMVTVETVGDPITQDQRGYYQAAILPAICEYSGYRRKEAHDFLLHQFGPAAWYEIGSMRQRLPTMTTGSNGRKDVMSHYLDAIMHWGDEEGIYIPPPANRKRW